MNRIKHLLMAVFDDKARQYSPPFSVPSVGLGSRLFEELLNTPGSNCNKWPDDFRLYQIGYFFPESGEVERLDAPVFLAHGVDLHKGRKQAMPEAVRPGVLHAVKDE